MIVSACLIQADAVLCALFKVASLRDKNYSKSLKCGNLWHLKRFSDNILYTHSVKLTVNENVWTAASNYSRNDKWALRIILTCNTPLGPAFLLKKVGKKQLSIVILMMHFVIRAIQVQVSVIGVLTHRPEGHDNSLLQGSDLIRPNSN